MHFSTLPITLPSYKMLHHIVYSRWSPLLFITTYSCFLLTSCSGGILNYSLCLQSRVITSSHFVRPSMCCSLVTQFSKKQSYGNLQNSCLGIILCQFPRGKNQSSLYFILFKVPSILSLSILILNCGINT